MSDEVTRGRYHWMVGNLFRGLTTGALLGLFMWPAMMVVYGEGLPSLPMVLMAVVLTAVSGGLTMIQVKPEVNQWSSPWERRIAGILAGAIMAGLITLMIWPAPAGTSLASLAFMTFNIGLFLGQTAGGSALHDLRVWYWNWSGREPRQPDFGPPPGHPEAEVTTMD